MKLHFTKMHGAGNDYIYVDCISQPLPQWGELEGAVVRLSNRHFGIGSDGLVLILPSDKADLRMRMFNADGSEAQMCGNAARCVARYAYDHNLVNKNTFTLETLAGIKTLRVETSSHGVSYAEGVETPYIASPITTTNVETPFCASPSETFRVSVNMGEPKIIEKDLTTLSVISPDSWLLTPDSAQAVSMGNPHAVFFVPRLDEIDVHKLGKTIEHDPLFPERTNVEFVEILNKTEVRMRVWERGSGETLACGTGACAVCVAGATLGLTERNITLHLLGGDLQVNWQPDNHVILTGPAEYAFTGEFIIDNE